MTPVGRIAVLVSTYNKPTYLRLVLNGYRQQDDTDLALYIADDGSGAETRALIKTFAADAPFPVRHVWHEDQGFRKCRIHNRALRLIREDYIILTDGDCVPPQGLVAAHRRHAQRGCFLSGDRILCSQAWTQQLCQTAPSGLPASFAGWLSLRLRGEINRLLPLLLPVRAGAPNTRLKGIRGCHLSCWRDDIMRVNGFDEQFEGWGREDSDLAARLLHAGNYRRNLRGVPVLHLWHEEEPRHRLDTNDAMLRECLESRRTRALKGVDEIR